MADDLAGMTVGVTDLARLFRVTAETIRNWVRDGMPKAGHNLYPLGEAVYWVRQRDLAAARGEDGDLVDERRKLVREQRRGHELDNQQKAAELLPAEQVASDIMAFAAIVAGQLDALPQRVSPRLVAITDPNVIRGVLRDECRTIRSAASQAFAAYGDSIRGGEDSQPAAGKGRRAVGRRASRVAARQPGAGAVAD